MTSPVKLTDAQKLEPYGVLLSNSSEDKIPTSTPCSSQFVRVVFNRVS